MTADHPPIRVVAVTILGDDGRLLVVRKRGTHAFMQPGGKPEPGESAIDTAVREVGEELGVELVEPRFSHHWRGPAANEPGRDIEATVVAGRIVGRPVAAAEIEELRWLDLGPDADQDVEAQAAPYVVAPLLQTVIAALRRVVVVGMGAEGWSGLSEPVRSRILAAPRVIGAPRLVEQVPVVSRLAALAPQPPEGFAALAPQPPEPSVVEVRGAPATGPDSVVEVRGAPATSLETTAPERLAWPRPFSIDLVRPGDVVLASGDPLVSGVGSTLIEALGADAVEVVPHVSAIALARARMGWSAESSVAVTTVGRRVETVLRECAPGRRILVLTSGPESPGLIAGHLVEAGLGDSRLTVLGDLGAESESRVTETAAQWFAQAATLHVLAIEVVGEVTAGWSSGLPDDVFDHDGQLTKRDLRASALARLQPMPGQVLWDVGAGAGSVGIEWMRAHPTCRTHAVERDPARVARIARNAARLGVPDLVVHEAGAPDGLVDLPDPDAIFVGGGATASGLLEMCCDRLRPGGRLVVHGVTVETETLLAEAYRRFGGELTRHSVETAAPLGGFTGWHPARAVTQWAWRKQ